MNSSFNIYCLSIIHYLFPQFAPFAEEYYTSVFISSSWSLNLLSFFQLCSMQTIFVVMLSTNFLQLWRSALEQKKAEVKKEYGVIDYDAPTEKNSSSTVGLGTKVISSCYLTQIWTSVLWLLITNFRTEYGRSESELQLLYLAWYLPLETFFLLEGICFHFPVMSKTFFLPYMFACSFHWLMNVI